MFDSSEDKVREAALRILDYGDCSEAEMKRKLKKKGFSEEMISPVIHTLADSGLLDDERFAESYVRAALEKGKGPAWIRNKLTEKGISSSSIALVFEKLDATGKEKELCLNKALSLLELKNDYETDGDGHLLPTGRIVSGRPPDPFGRRIPDGADRREARKLREKEKGRLARRLAGAGFSQSAVYSVLRELEQASGSGTSED